MRTSLFSSASLSAARIGAVALGLVTVGSTALAEGASQGSTVMTGPISMVYDGACLFAYGLADLAPIEQYACLGSADQSFQLVGTGDGISFAIASSNSGMCLSISGSSVADGAPVVQDTCNGASNELFIPVRYSDGSYQLISMSSGKCLEVPNSSTSVVPLDQLSCTGGANQRFNLPLPAGDILLGGTLAVQATGAPVNAPTTPLGWNIARNTKQ